MQVTTVKRDSSFCFHGMRSRNNKGHTIFVSALTWAGAATKEVTIAVPTTNRTKQKWVWMKFPIPNVHHYILYIHRVRCNWSEQRPELKQTVCSPKTFEAEGDVMTCCRISVWSKKRNLQKINRVESMTVCFSLTRNKPLVPFKRHIKRNKRNRRNLCQKLYEIFVIFTIWLDTDRN